MEFDEQKAVAFMRERAGVEYDDDQLLNVIDIIFDYYEDHDMLDIDDDTDADEEQEMKDLIAHVSKMLSKDKGAEIAPGDIEALVRAEVEYEYSLV